MDDAPKSKIRAPAVADVMGVIGLALLSAGAWMAYHPAGLIVPGAVLFCLAALRTYGAPRA